MRRGHLLTVTLGTVAALAASGAVFSAATAESTPSGQQQLQHLGAIVPGRVLIHYRAGAGIANETALEHASSASRVARIAALGTEVLDVPAGSEAAAAAKLRASKLVDYAELDGAATADDITPNDPKWSGEWGQVLIHAPHAWGVSTGSSNVVVAVVDTGLTPGLAEFAGRTLTGYNAITGTTNTTDDNGHGNYVSGVALAQGNNGIGVAGMCWSCRLLPVKVLDANGNGDYATIASGITWAADHGAKVINLSLGGTTSSATLDNAVSYATNKGVLVVVAAGNSGCDCKTWPAASPGALSVGATDATDKLYSYSNRGTWVDVAAPGSNYSTGGDGNFYPFGGTSSAAPVVSGTAALAFAAAPTTSTASVISALESTTHAVSGGGVSFGRMDAGAALDAIVGGAAVPPAPSPSPTTSPSASASPSPSPTTSPTSSPAPAPTSSKPAHGKH